MSMVNTGDCGYTGTTHLLALVYSFALMIRRNIRRNRHGYTCHHVSRTRKGESMVFLVRPDLYEYTYITYDRRIVLA